ncbi:hypothetical protein FA95DRAFT_1607570 [Auriscalpium vulgare]|uniref:Uncharacterized protein n=1 Tax=Auriscalpium vulgare TaxID=40419 RepID=A0ACB8RNN8_9AGAM|nr:hypothetical protein FA95DRAFT_1607570 [Auriscalpium vulgare]
MSVDASRIPDGTSYWANASATRTTQLGATPQYIIDLANNLVVVEDREAFLRATISTIVQHREDEERALCAAITAIKHRYDKRLVAAKAALHVARIQHNTLIPVARLPVEVLERIFVLLVAQDPFQSNHLGWIPRATHVCRAWRQVALGYPRLWSTMALPLWNREWTTTMLARSGTHPLTIKAGMCLDEDTDIESNTDSESIVDSDSETSAGHSWARIERAAERTMAYEGKLILRNLYRTCSLRIISNFRSRNFLDVLGSTYPMLERVEIETSFYSSFPDALGSHTPALREFCVICLGIDFRWTLPYLTTVVTFELRRMRFGNPEDESYLRCYAPTQDDVVNALQRMPALQTLIIDTDIRNHSVDAEAQVATVNLPRLVTLSLITRFRDAQLLFARITIPFSTSLKISLQNNTDDENYEDEIPRREDPGAFFLALRPHIHSPDADDSPIVKLVITSIGPWSVPVTAATGVKIYAWRGDERAHTPPVLLELPRGSRRWGGGTLVLAAVRALASEHLRELAVLDVAWDEATWATALEAAPAVRSIEAVGGAALALCRVLAGCLSTPMSDTPAQVVLPDLTSLTLRDVSFNARYARRALDRKNLAPRLRVGDLLPEMLAARSRTGSPLACLNLRRCNLVSPTHLSQLRAALPDALIVEPCGNPPGSRALMWGSSNTGDSANKRILAGRRGGTLLVCARHPADSGSEELVVLDELEVRDDQYEPQETEVLTRLGYRVYKSDSELVDGDEEDEGVGSYEEDESEGSYEEEEGSGSYEEGEGDAED